MKKIIFDLDKFNALLNEPSSNPRKKYFDRENQEVVKVLQKVRK